MSAAILTVDLDALVANWRALDAQSNAETAAVVKADGYGLGAAKVSRALARAGARRFFTATAEEAALVRQALGPGPMVGIFSGHMSGDTDMIGDLQLTPMINSIDQMLRHVEALPGAPFGVQLDTGMNRLGMEAGEWDALRDIATAQNLQMVMSHLACADDPSHEMNATQLAQFRAMTDGLNVPRSLSATGGILLGPEYHFDITRPGIGLYGALPFADAQQVVTLDIPVIQSRVVLAGETVGYSNTWTAPSDRRIATIAAGYADGIHRLLGNHDLQMYYGSQPCPVVGRISMDMIAVDITDLGEEPTHLQLMGPLQTPDSLAAKLGTIGYEMLTSLGARYHRRYRGG